MSKYSDISKMIGWDDRNVSVPSKSLAQNLADVVENGNPRDSESAFISIFTIIRFAKAKDEQDVDNINIIYEAFGKAKSKYESN